MRASAPARRRSSFGSSGEVVKERWYWMMALPRSGSAFLSHAADRAFHCARNASRFFWYALARPGRRGQAYLRWPANAGTLCQSVMKCGCLLDGYRLGAASRCRACRSVRRIGREIDEAWAPGMIFGVLACRMSGGTNPNLQRGAVDEEEVRWRSLPMTKARHHEMWIFIHPLRGWSHRLGPWQFPPPGPRCTDR